MVLTPEMYEYLKIQTSVKTIFFVVFFNGWVFFFII